VGFLLPAAIIVVLDQITKQLFWRNGQNYDIIDGFLRITLVKNAGAAFGLFQGGRVFFIAASIVAIIFILYVGLRLRKSDWQRRLLLGMILGGAIGNLIDRAYAGEVIDFIDMGIGVHRWPVFNVADMGVSVGATILLIYLMRAPRAAPDASVGGALDAPAGVDDPGRTPAE
jgi:signal peptidase II